MRSEVVKRPSKWWADPLSWVELFALSNIAFLAVDIGLAHAVNNFANPAEYVPIVFSIAAPLILVGVMAAGGIRPLLSSEGSLSQKLGRRLGLLIGWCSMAVGVAGFLLHLNSSFFVEQSIKNLVYCAPFVAPLAYTGIGLLLILNRMIDSRTLEWARWVILLALGGFAGNYVLTLTDHAQNGFFRSTEWIGVVASAWAVSSLVAVLVVYDNRPLLGLTLGAMISQIAVGLLGSYFHIAADYQAETQSLWSRILYGAPVFAPMLFADLAILGMLSLWALALVCPPLHISESQPSTTK